MHREPGIEANWLHTRDLPNMAIAANPIGLSAD